MKRRQLTATHSDSEEEEYDDSDDFSSESQSKKPRLSSVAEKGVLEKVELVNFMCHKHLEVKLGPRINFIIGANGSGKSAILTAITVCLGGKASSTARASSVKALIKTGETYAEIVLTVRNRGSEAFKPAQYGNQIVISRRITKDSNTYKLKSQDGKIISSRKDELATMLDHFSIQADNPLMILNQDAAKVFLQSSTPQQRYAMFMKGTQLQQLEDDYAKVKINIDSLNAVVDRKLKLIPDLKSDVKRAKNRLKHMEAAIHVENNMENLKKQVAWSQVLDSNVDVVATMTTVDNDRVRLEQLENKIQHIKAEQAAVQADYDRLNDIVNNNASRGLLEDRKSDINRLIRNVEKDLPRMTSDEKEMNNEITQLKKDKADCEKLKEQELAKFSSASLTDLRMEKRDSIAKLELQISADSTELDLQERAFTADTQVDPIHEVEHSLHQLNLQQQRTHAELTIYKQELDVLKHSSNGKLALYGENVHHMLQEIELMTSKGVFSKSPIGPIGIYIEIKNRIWATAIDAHVKPNTLYAFIVQSSNDVQTLMKLFEKYKYGILDRSRRSVARFHDIFTAKVDHTFDFILGCPNRDSRWTTILEQLSFTDDLVQQVLINSSQIESVILVKSRLIGEEVMGGGFPRNVSACYDKDANKIGHRGGGKTNFAMGKKSSGQGGFDVLCAPDAKHRIEELNHFIQELQHRWSQFEARRVDVEKEKLHIMRSRNSAQELIGNLRKMLRNKRNNLDRLKDELVELNQESCTDSIRRLEDMIAEHERKICYIKKQFQNYLDERNRIAGEKQKLLQEFRKIQQDIDDLDSNVKEERNQLEVVTQRMPSFQREIDHYSRSKKTCEDNLREHSAQYTLKHDAYEQLRRQALEFTDGIEIEVENHGDKTTKQLERELRSLHETLKYNQNLTGTVEEAMEDYQRKEDLLRSTADDCNTLVGVIDALIHSLAIRMERWNGFRRCISARACINFQFLLEHRQYSGSLDFDHDNKKLIITVKTNEEVEDNQISATFKTRKSSVMPHYPKRTVASDLKDPRSLSGGEKSFSTVCLLLALWESMSSHIRALDEFDVYMDASNRFVSMQMMVDAAKSAQQVQFILITPQGMEKIKLTEDVRVIRLDDPARLWAGGQRTLEGMAASTL